MGILPSCVFLVFASYLFRYQVAQNAQHRDYVDAIATQQNKLHSLRGKIFDRNYNIALAKNVSSYQIVLTPALFSKKHREQSIKELAELLNLSTEFIEGLLQKRMQEDEYLLVDNLLYSELAVYLEQLGNYPGVNWKRNTKRYYPFNDSMSHIVGYVGNITQNEKKLLNFEGYTLSDKIGKTGIEKQYEHKLRGEVGQKLNKVTATGKNVKDSEEIVRNSKPGNDLILTIDRNIQNIVEKAIGERVGAAVVLKPSTGEILSMVSYPRFNSNIFSSSPDKRLISQIRKNIHSPLFNRAIQASTSPASTFKILLLLAYYQEFPREWNTPVYDRGYVMVGNRAFYDWYRLGRGWITPSNALSLSNNVFFYTIGVDKLGVNTIIRYADMLGLGNKTNIDLPGEVGGILPSPRWKSLRYREVWQDGDTANLSIGQGYLAATPIQLANILAFIVNEGTIYTPYLLKEIREQISGKIVERYSPKVLFSTDAIHSGVFTQLKRDMRKVVVSGTAQSVINTDVVDIAAKTGTGQGAESVDEQQYSSLFVSFAPYAAPAEDQIIVVIWIDAINEWEWWAPKAANIIYHAIFTNSTYEEAIADLEEKGTWYL
ncbi:peptidoglycan D,D-transpeptidase MrdA-like [Ylistrum balloti]|uniref:peptidoglycan D,D-transpeptidase MrdA-like n=1 Tax=Ylistrum balloti TaxID=509963 RepID=UPI002905C6F6|nr:peptidoglycan D,D-transpeptidase MrdA-like [Ylistrum balloti]